ncbi:MAG: CHAP domain-containing protein [Candidatus Saccharibacteria bacterium]|nr:CHAP domain-containing protein [Candidatus Saccharibacteria bacterium]
MIKKHFIILVAAVVLVSSFMSQSVLAISDEQRRILESNILFYNVDATDSIADSCTLLVAGKGDIFNETQLEQIERNRLVYEEAGQEADVPWEMLAVIHLKESGLGRENPSNGQGVYQFVNKNGGPYPPGPVNEAEFVRQTKLAAQFVRSKLPSNLEHNRNLTYSGASSDTIKDTFFSYNGRSSGYADQAEALGFDRERQPFEGSPYVMNKADPQRDPEINTTTWGQVKEDFGPIEYPANNFYGAYVSYAALAGTGTDNCDQNLGIRVVEIAQEELALGANEADNSYFKYTEGIEAAWCAYFVSWVFDKAGAPFEGGPLPQVSTMQAYARDRGMYYESDDSTFTPQPGDIVVYKEGVLPFESHVNIVISYNAGTEIITTIGGNESDTILELTNERSLPSISGFIRIQ